MSSHHIVKDKQEPALIIANGEECSFELMGQLLEWSPFIVVLDGAVHRVLELGIKFDVLLGDFDRIHELEELVQHQYPLEIIHTPDQNATDLEKAIQFLIDRQFPAANIIWATGKRADHTLANITNLVKFKNQIDLVMLDNYSKIFPLKPLYEKWYPASTNLSIMPVNKVEGIITSGLQYNLNNESLEPGIRIGSSNLTLIDGFIKIEHQSGDLLLMECID